MRCCAGEQSTYCGICSDLAPYASMKQECQFGRCAHETYFILVNAVSAMAAGADMASVSMHACLAEV